MRAVFSGIARRYDLFNTLSSLGLDRHWRQAAVKAARLRPGSRVLDLCCGTGELALALARQGKSAEVVATDFTPAMLDIARRKTADAKTLPTRISFAVADAHDLQFDDASFDVVTVAFGVRNLADRAANFADVLRVLKPGGRYVVLEFTRPPTRVWRGLYKVYLGTVLPALGALLTNDRAAYEYLNESIRRFPAQPALAAELRSAGYSAISWTDLTGGIVSIHLAVK